MMDPFGSRAFRGGIDPHLGLDHYAVARGEVRPDTTILVECEMGATLYDLIWTGNAAPLLISQKVVHLFTEEDVSGWGTYPVEVRDKTGAEVTGYWGLVVHGRCGPIRDDMSPIIDVTMPGGIFQSYKGWYFDPATWDGSDIFVTEGSGVLRFVREKVRKLFDRHKIRNVKLIKATEDVRMM